MRRLADERGAALVESVLGIVIILLLSMGVLTLTQVIWTHLDLSSTVTDVARYAARVEYDPSATPVTSSRHRTADQIKAYATRAGSEAGVTSSDVAVSPAAPETLRTGDRITVTITKTVSNPLYKVGASITNAATGIFQLGRAFDPDGIRIKSEATSYVE